MNVRTLTIAGTFKIVSTGGIGFGFNFPANVVVQNGGKLQDQTDTNRIYIRKDSILTFLPGSSFSGTNTKLYTFGGSISEATSSSTASASFGSTIKVPFTLTVSPDGTTRRFRSVMCLARQSGGFRDSATWLGGVAPTLDFCASAGGCDIYIPPGITLSTDSLDGELDIQFNQITVSSGAIFQLGKAGLTKGFRFKLATTLQIFGTLQDVTGGTGGILVPVKSSLNVFFGARFTSSLSTFLRVFDSTTGSSPWK